MTGLPPPLAAADAARTILSTLTRQPPLREGLAFAERKQTNFHGLSCVPSVVVGTLLCAVREAQPSHLAVTEHLARVALKVYVKAHILERMP